jgi:hypothetical protein
MMITAGLVLRSLGEGVAAGFGAEPRFFFAAGSGSGDGGAAAAGTDGIAGGANAGAAAGGSVDAVSAGAGVAAPDFLERPKRPFFFAGSAGASGVAGVAGSPASEVVTGTPPEDGGAVGAVATERGSPPRPVSHGWTAGAAGGSAKVDAEPALAPLGAGTPPGTVTAGGADGRASGGSASNGELGEAALTAERRGT